MTGRIVRWVLWTPRRALGAVGAAVVAMLVVSTILGVVASSVNGSAAASGTQAADKTTLTPLLRLSQTSSAATTNEPRRVRKADALTVAQKFLAAWQNTS